MNIILSDVVVADHLCYNTCTMSRDYCMLQSCSLLHGTNNKKIIQER